MNIAAIPPGVCPRCGEKLVDQQWDQLALVRHGGYGAAERTVRRVCPNCSWSFPAETRAVKP